MFKRKLLWGGLAFWLLGAASVHAAVSAEEAAQLSSGLTPFGAEKAGNADGSIPEWNGGFSKEQIPPSYSSPGQHHPDPFADDKPLFVITKANLNQYAGNLSEGAKALFDAYPDTFKMPVYASRRTHSLPEWVMQNGLKNATTAQLTEGGNGITSAYGGVPFPIPKANGEYDPLMILWNHILRYRGSHVVHVSSEAAVHKNGDYALISRQEEAGFSYYKKDGKFEDLNNIMVRYLGYIIGPARMAGDAVLVHESLDQTKQPRQSWIYSAGQHRVRKIPVLGYDTPVPSSDGLRTADDTDMFNGAPDRYQWQYLGKKELYIPYNNYKLGSGSTKYADVLKKGHINPDLARYELHRVWVIQGTLKPGMRHIYAKRTFYIDEDSWSIVMADQYDNRGKLWRVSTAYLKNFYEVPLTWSALDVFHDLQAQRYSVQGLDSEEQNTADFSRESPPDSYFSPTTLRRLGIR